MKSTEATKTNGSAKTRRKSHAVATDARATGYAAEPAPIDAASATLGRDDEAAADMYGSLERAARDRFDSSSTAILFRGLADNQADPLESMLSAIGRDVGSLADLLSDLSGAPLGLMMGFQDRIGAVEGLRRLELAARRHHARIGALALAELFAALGDGGAPAILRAQAAFEALGGAEDRA